MTHAKLLTKKGGGMSTKKAAKSTENKGGKGGRQTAKKAEPTAKAAEPKATAAGESSLKRAEGNPFRDGSAYAACFDILAAHKAGIRRDELVRLLAQHTGKDEKRAGFNVQVLLSAKPNEDGLNNNDSPRHRACRKGFYVRRENDHVKLMIDHP